MLETVKQSCPYCGEPIELVVDASVASQTYIEDCFVCCRPITVNCACDEGDVYVTVAAEDEV